jgi:hypothetical protein
MSVAGESVGLAASSAIRRVPSGPVSLPRYLSRMVPSASGRVVAVPMTAAIAACSPAPPDLVLLNADVFTANPSTPWAEALIGGRSVHDVP